MKRLIPAVIVILGWVSAAWAVESGTLTTLRAIHELSNAQASQSLPVAFEATVTFYRSYEHNLFVQDGDAAVFILIATNAKLVPGDRVLVRGKTRSGFRPIVLGDSVTVLYHGALLKPKSANFAQMIHAERDCMLAVIHGVVRSADVVMSNNAPSIYLQLLMDGGYVDINSAGSDATWLKTLLDSEVEVTGVVSGEFDSKGQLTGIVLEMPTLSDIKVLKRASISPESLQVTPMDQLLGSFFVRDLIGRVRVHGTITYYQPGSAVVLQDGSKSLWIMTHSEQPLRVGDMADATGFPDVSAGLLTLNRGEILDSHRTLPIMPRQVSGTELVSGNNAFDLVSVQGRVLTAIGQAAQDEYVLVADGHLFSAIIPHPNVAEGAQPPPMKQISTGSIARITGICILHYGSDPFTGPISVDILMRSFDDIAVVANPSLLNIRNLIIVVSLLLIVVVAVGIRGWIIERRVRRQTALLAQLEQRRSRVLEDINSTMPLAEILEQITGLVSFRLDGAPCWCEIAGGARLGENASDNRSQRIIHEEIPARAGPALGKLFTALAAKTLPNPAEKEALLVGARLATLAIETRELYSDLCHRSEFDLLTDIHNRFSLEKRLDEQIEAVRQSAGTFGLIYIDLDGFKQVNDLYGHHIGDLYLQEVARRMKQQLRTHDLLARLGGDEFAVLLPMVRSRASVEEIALRLDHSFDHPFILDGHTLHGSASFGIALYPEDGATRDELLNSADAAMYETKKNKKLLAASAPDENLFAAAQSK